MRIGTLAEVRRPARPGMLVSGGVLSLDEQFAAFMAALTGPRLLLDPSRAASRFQDAAGSTLVTADGQPFARLNDASGAGNHVNQSTAASMSLYRTDGVLHWGQFDGSNDSWQSLVSLNLTSTNKVTVIAGVRKLSDATAGIVYEFGPVAATTDGSFGLFAPRNNASGMDFSPVSRGTASVQITSTLAAPVSAVVTVQKAISGPALNSLRINGTQVASSAVSQGSGNYGNLPLNIGRRNEASMPFNGNLYGLLIVGRLLTSDELSLCERWMASKTGVTL